MTYNATVMSNNEFAEITGQHPKFKDGFITNNCDWWESLEKYLKKPMVSVRPAGREGYYWNNKLLILTADGKVTQNSVIINGNVEYVSQFAEDIFLETGSVVFDDYVFQDLSTEELTNLKGWWYKYNLVRKLTTQK